MKRKKEKKKRKKKKKEKKRKKERKKDVSRRNGFICVKIKTDKAYIIIY